MTYDLFYAHPCYSSWSLRAWLIFQHFDLPYTPIEVDIYRGGKARDLAPVAPARTVPVLRTPEGYVIGDSLALAETLVERHPDQTLWPLDGAARALARWITAEMHSGFSALRGACPMVLTHQITDFTPGSDVLGDLGRIEDLWSLARTRHGSTGPWLFGQYTLADAFYAPVAMRIAGYDLPVGAEARAYVQAHLEDPAVVEWRAKGLADPITPPPYTVPGTQGDWPGA